MFWKRVKNKLFPEYARRSYSQCGEDLILAFVFDALHIEKPSYVDLGAYHARQFSNTFYFYKRGSRGLAIEANPQRSVAFQKARPRDLCVNAGITAQAGNAMDFYILSYEALSTFSKDAADAIAREGKNRIKKVISIPTYRLSEVLARYHFEAADLVSIDIEGHELDALQSLDWSRGRPKVFCVETLTYSETKKERKQTETIDWMEKNGYRLLADTFINSIFVDEKSWAER